MDQTTSHQHALLHLSVQHNIEAPSPERKPKLAVHVCQLLSAHTITTYLSRKRPNYHQSNDGGIIVKNSTVARKSSVIWPAWPDPNVVQWEIIIQQRTCPYIIKSPRTPMPPPLYMHFWGLGLCGVCAKRERSENVWVTPNKMQCAQGGEMLLSACKLLTSFIRKGKFQTEERNLVRNGGVCASEGTAQPGQLKSYLKKQAPVPCIVDIYRCIYNDKVTTFL